MQISRLFAASAATATLALLASPGLAAEAVPTSQAPTAVTAQAAAAGTSVRFATFNVRTSRADIGTSRQWLRRALSVAQEIERRLHRVRTIRWGPRTLDIDILLYGDRIFQQEGLTVPHPRMEERAFVLIPLLEVAGNLRIPGSGATVRERIEEAPDRSGVRKTPHRIVPANPVVG